MCIEIRWGPRPVGNSEHGAPSGLQGFGEFVMFSFLANQKAQLVFIQSVWSCPGIARRLGCLTSWSKSIIFLSPKP